MGWDCESNHCRVDLSLKRLCERLAFFREKMVLLHNFNVSGKVSGSYPRRDSELDATPEQRLEGTALDLSKRMPWEVPGESRNFHWSDKGASGRIVACLRQF